MARILVIAPHPDDETLGCGGTIAKYTANNEEVYLCIITRVYSPEWPENELLQRKEETLAASSILGIKKTVFLNLPTVKLDTIPQKQLNDMISDVVNTIQPEIVYVPHRGDINKDHQLVFDAAMVALRPLQANSVIKVLSYETLSETEWAEPFSDKAFIPNVYTDISDTLDIKLRAMSAYGLELREYPHPRSLEAISNLAKTRGASVGLRAAEAYTLIRHICR